MVSAASYCSHYLQPVSLTLVANLPPVSTTLVKLVAKFAVGVVDIGGKFAPVSLIPAVHLDLRISPPIFEKIRNGTNGILWGGGKLILEKSRSKKSRDTVPLNHLCTSMGPNGGSVTMERSLWQAVPWQQYCTRKWGGTVLVECWRCGDAIYETALRKCRHRKKSRLIASNAKCRHLIHFTAGCLSVWGPLPSFLG